MFRAFGLSIPVAKCDDRHNRLVLWDVEECAKGIGVAHTHDECVEAHGASLQNQVAVTQAIVVGSPSVANLIGLVALEEA